MKIDNNEKEGCAIRVNVPYQPSIIDITHDALHAVKGHVGVGRVKHGQENSAYNQNNQHDGGQRAEAPKIIAIFRHRIFTVFFLQIRNYRNAEFNPVEKRIFIFAGL